MNRVITQLLGSGSGRVFARLMIVLIILFCLAVIAVFGQTSPPYVEDPPAELTTDVDSHYKPCAATDTGKTWIIVWDSNHDVNSNGTDLDILYTRNDNFGVDLSWGTSGGSIDGLKSDDDSDTGADTGAFIATNGSNTWIAAWTCDICDFGSRCFYVSRSIDDGISWEQATCLANTPATGSVTDIDYSGGRWLVTAVDDQRSAIVIWTSSNNGASWEVAPRSISDPNYPSASNGLQDKNAIVEISSNDVLGAVWLQGNSLVFSASADKGDTWAVPVSIPGSDWASDRSWNLDIAAYGDSWIVAWLDIDLKRVMYARSNDGGASWAVEILNDSIGGIDFGYVNIETDRFGALLATWSVLSNITSDWRMSYKISYDGGVNWSSETSVFSNPAARYDGPVSLVSHNYREWRLTWQNGCIFRTPSATDCDINTTRLVAPCGNESPEVGYGTLLFPRMCTQYDGGLAQGSYDGMVTIPVDVNSKYYVSSKPNSFASISVDDEIHINQTNSQYQIHTRYEPDPFPPGVVNTPMEAHLKPQPPLELSGSMASSVDFELYDVGLYHYGNSPLYLLKDCGVWPENDTTLSFIGYGVTGTAVVKGLLSDLRVDRDFSKASCEPPQGTTYDMSLDDPPINNGYYYLIRGMTTTHCADTVAYGVSSDGTLRMPPTCP